MSRVYYQFENILSGLTGGNGRDPNLKFGNMSVEKRIEHLLKPGQMKGKFLGACLDSCRLGTMNTCYWPMNIHGLMGFIQKWRDENNDQESLYHEEPLEKIFSRFELPRINHENCPRDKNHSETFIDAVGRVRCAHKDVKQVKPSFLRVSDSSSWDSDSQTKYFHMWEDEPREPEVYDEDTGEMVIDEGESPLYLEKRARYDAEEPVDLVDVCYSIIQEPKTLVLPFETILIRENIHPETKTVFCGSRFSAFSECRRLYELDKEDRKLAESIGHCPGHVEDTNASEFLFDGWTMAYYLLRWKQQGNASWFAEKKEYWPSREQLRISSED